MFDSNSMNVKKYFFGSASGLIVFELSMRCYLGPPDYFIAIYSIFAEQNRTRAGAVDWWEKRRLEISCYSVFNGTLFCAKVFCPAQPGSWERPLVPSLLKLLFITTLDLPPKPPKPHIKGTTFPEWDFKIKFNFAPKINENILCFEDSLCFSFCAKCEVEF